jgi:NDP-sugar pyrophosphorylase family protein
MKALICLGKLDEQRLSEGFGSISSAMLPVANKALLEYYIDFCSSVGVTNILILDSDFSSEVADFLGTGARWSVSLNYIGAETSSTLEELTGHHASFLAKDSVLWLNGTIFPFFDYRTLNADQLIVECELPWDGSPLPSGLFLLGRQTCQRLAGEVLLIDSFAGYHRCNRRVLASPEGHFPVPGYHVEQGVCTGMNVVIPASVRIKAPVLLGNNVRLGEGVELGGVVSIGDDVMIDSGTHLRDSIVFDNTYVGRNLELDHKIVCRDRIIDPRLDVVLNLEDEGLSMDIRRFTWDFYLHWCLDAVAAFLLILVQTPIYALLRMTKKMASEPCFFYGQRHRGRYFHQYRLNLGDRRDLYFYKCSLDKYWLLWMVLSGDLRLMGDSVDRIPDDGETAYRPGAFCFSDTRNRSSSAVQRALDDRYFRHNRSFWMVLECLLKIIVGRFFSGRGY